MNIFQETWVTALGGSVLSVTDETVIRITSAKDDAVAPNQCAYMAKNLIDKRIVNNTIDSNDINVGALLPDNDIKTVLLCSGSVPDNAIRIQYDAVIILAKDESIACKIVVDKEYDLIVDSVLLASCRFNVPVSVLAGSEVFDVVPNEDRYSDLLIYQEVVIESSNKALETRIEDGVPVLHYPLLLTAPSLPFAGFCFTKDTIFDISDDLTVGELRSSNVMSALIVNILTGMEK